MSVGFTTIQYNMELNIGKESRIITVTWVQIDVFAHCIPECPRDFYIIQTTDQDGKLIPSKRG